MSRPSFVADVLPALVWTLLVFAGGSIPAPAPDVGMGFPGDKLGHLVAFGVLQSLTLRALRYSLPEGPPRGRIWGAALIATLFGGLLELYQLALPHRSAELADLAADAAGAILFALGAEFWSRRKSPSRAPAE